MNLTATKTKPQFILKVVAPEYQQITKLNDSLEIIRSSSSKAPIEKMGKSCHLRTIQRKRKLWARKRSPHVFSKSQESFGYETYTGSFERTPVVTRIINKEISHDTNWPVSYRSLRNNLNHRIPGLARSWTFTSHR